MKSQGISAEAEAYFYSQTCPDCQGDRLNEISRSVTVENRTIPELVNCSLDEYARMGPSCWKKL